MIESNYVKTFFRSLKLLTKVSLLFKIEYVKIINYFVIVSNKQIEKFCDAILGFNITQPYFSILKRKKKRTVNFKLTDRIFTFLYL